MYFWRTKQEYGEEGESCDLPHILSTILFIELKSNYLYQTVEFIIHEQPSESFIK